MSKTITLQQIALIFDCDKKDAIEQQCGFCNKLQGGKWCEEYPQCIPDTFYFGKKECLKFQGDNLETPIIQQKIDMKEKIRPGFKAKFLKLYK